MQVLERPPRKDALPEHVDWRDIGCHVHPACLSCPLERCIFEDPRAFHRAALESRVQTMILLFRQGMRPTEVARNLGVSRRTVFRWLASLRRAEGDG